MVYYKEMEKILRIIERFIPRRLYKMGQPIYHYLITFVGAVIYRFPSKKIHIVGITGTKGKSSTAEFVNAILEEEGLKTALSNTIRFKIGNETKPNMYKMSMPGRFFMQKFLHDAVSEGCTHAVIEITSEGAKLFRNKFIDLDALIFTNIAPEHIESHGSFENYVKAKVSIAAELEKSSKPRRVVVANTDDKEAYRFLERDVNERYTYGLVDAEPYMTDENGVYFTYKGTKMSSEIKGVFNIYNMLAAATYADVFGIEKETIAKAFGKLNELKGRIQHVKTGQDFDVVVDYAHTADSLEALYKAFPNQKKICLLGSTGGGRDKWKRPAMGKVADTYCDYIILADEDPYDEDPMEIIEGVQSGIKNKTCEIIIDRALAIEKAVQLGYEWQKNGEKVAVLISGKGTDPYIMGPNGSRVEWSDAKVAESALLKHNNNQKI